MGGHPPQAWGKGQMCHQQGSLPPWPDPGGLLKGAWGAGQPRSSCPASRGPIPPATELPRSLAGPEVGNCSCPSLGPHVLGSRVFTDLKGRRPQLRAKPRTRRKHLCATSDRRRTSRTCHALDPRPGVPLREHTDTPRDDRGHGRWW